MDNVRASRRRARPQVEEDGVVHGVSTLFSLADARRLDAQESGYAITEIAVMPYGSSEELLVEVYTQRSPLPDDHPEGCFLMRYRDVLVRGAHEMNLEVFWVCKLRDLPVYTPSAVTLARRHALPPPTMLQIMSIAELTQHNGSNESKPVLTASCGYVFEHKPPFRVMWG